MTERGGAYTRLHAQGLLQQRVKDMEKITDPCNLCPRGCGVYREETTGACGIGNLPQVASYGPHPGEERVLLGSRGSGTIFFYGCTLHCVFCQNYDISRGRGRESLEPRELASLMLELQRYGCGNINLVTPSHVLPWILEALIYGVEEGLTLPLVYNCGGYESLEALALLDQVVDIYMPDIKYGNNALGQAYSGVPDYWDRAKAALLEMHRQVGDLCLDRKGQAYRGLLIRHLILPGHLESSSTILHFLAQELSTHTYINLMDQYYPAHKSREYGELGRSLSFSEYRRVVQQARDLGFTRLD